MTIMRDSTNPVSIPVDTPIVAGYVDGLYKWPASGWARFPTTHKRRISTTTINTASDVADIEGGNVSAVLRLQWYRNMKDMGITDLWLYCSRSLQHGVEDTFWNAGIRDVKMWIATLDGTQVVQQYRYPVVSVQYIDTGAYDESVVNDAVYGPIEGEVMNLSQKRAAVRTAYHAAFGRGPESDQVLNGWANQILDDGSNEDAIITQIVDSAEGQKHEAEVRALIAAGPAQPPSTTVPAHKHSLTINSSTGDVQP